MVEVEDEESEGVSGPLGTSDFLLEPLDSEPAVVDRRQRIESGNPLQILVIEGIGEGDGQVGKSRLDDGDGLAIHGAGCREYQDADGGDSVADGKDPHLGRDEGDDRPGHGDLRRQAENPDFV